MKAKNNNWFALLGFILLIPSIILNLIFFQRLKKQDVGVTVLAVLDGDTIVLENKTRLRLREIDAPEPEYCGGKEAKALLEKLVKDKQVIIREQIPDQRGRGMAYVFAGNTFVNLEILKAGWARYHHDQTEFSTELKKVHDTAKQELRGIYSPSCYQTENLEHPKCIIKGNIDEKGRKLYYLPLCAQYKFAVIEKDMGEDWFCTEKQAQKAGYSKAATCPK